MNCQVWLHDHVIPVYNAGIKTFINYVDKSLPGHLMKATKMIWKHNIQVFKLHVYQGVQFCSEMKKKTRKYNESYKFNSSCDTNFFNLSRYCP